jgi:thiamine biosynthesis lipoprotein
VNAGGDLYCLGDRTDGPWRVGIRDPDRGDEIVVVLNVADAAVATSGDYQRYFEYDGIRYHHILDPQTGRPARRARSATVIAPTAERADALATAAFVAGPDAGIQLLDGLENAEGMIIDLAGDLHTSARFGEYVALRQARNRDNEVES